MAELVTLQNLGLSFEIFLFMKEVLILHFHFDRNEKKYEYVSNMVCIVIEQTLFTLSQYITMYHMAHSHIPALPHTIILSITKYDHQSVLLVFFVQKQTHYLILIMMIDQDWVIVTVNTNNKVNYSKQNSEDGQEVSRQILNSLQFKLAPLVLSAEVILPL